MVCLFLNNLLLARIVNDRPTELLFWLWRYFLRIILICRTVWQFSRTHLYKRPAIAMCTKWLSLA